MHITKCNGQAKSSIALCGVKCSCSGSGCCLPSHASIRPASLNNSNTRMNSSLLLPRELHLSLPTTPIQSTTSTVFPVLVPATSHARQIISMTSTVSTHPRLVWPRTDGDPSRWPATGTPSTTETWYVPIERSHKKYETYEETAGEHLAEILGIPKLPGEFWELLGNCIGLWSARHGSGTLGQVIEANDDGQEEDIIGSRCLRVLGSMCTSNRDPMG